jgi:16S rRNA (guanine(966)-N(2))-methyltransferase RsmD
MRVIAGRYRRRLLGSLPGYDLRPTSDRLRETLFNVLTAGNPSALEATIWLDLFAGTGSVGIEALSRGASMLYAVESSPPAAQLLRSNIRSLGIESGFQVLEREVSRGLTELERQAVAVDVIFLDPPYRLAAAYEETIARLANSTLLKPGGRVIAEHAKRLEPGAMFGALARYRKLVQGDAALSFYQKASASISPPASSLPPEGGRTT